MSIYHIITYHKLCQISGFKIELYSKLKVKNLKDMAELIYLNNYLFIIINII